jgi:hypothetical protein
MANRYGKGYYSDWYEMMQSLKLGSKTAFKQACQKICDEANERIRGGIYSTYQPVDYDRTFEMANIDYLTADVKDLECQFLFNNQEFAKLPIDSVGHHVSDSDDMAHHALSDDIGNGYDTQSFMDDIISPIHDEFMAEIRYYIQENFANIYRECCREIGFTLS